MSDAPFTLPLHCAQQQRKAFGAWLSTTRQLEALAPDHRAGFSALCALFDALADYAAVVSDVRARTLTTAQLDGARAALLKREAEFRAYITPAD